MSKRYACPNTGILLKLVENNFSEFKVLLEHDKKHPLRDFSKADKRDKKMVGR